jgi:hypothetical protein
MHTRVSTVSCVNTPLLCRNSKRSSAGLAYAAKGSISADLFHSSFLRRDKKTPQSLAGLVFMRLYLWLSISKTCPAAGVDPYGTKPIERFDMFGHAAHF